MGLDMHLQGRKYVAGYKVSITRDTEYKGVFPADDADVGHIKKVQYLIIEEGYWRKANHIHKWFVDNVQGGEDDCKEYYVDESQLKSLLDVVNKVLDASKLVKGAECKLIKDPSVAEELLPVAEGFFFGNTGYNEWYYNDLVDTKKIIEEALKNNDLSHYYTSSW